MQVKCRYCQTNIEKTTAYFHLDSKGKRAYFCNEEHYKSLCDKEEQKIIEKKRLKEEKQHIKEEKIAEVEKRKEEKDAVYYTICDIFGVKDIINTALWKEKKEWNKVANDVEIKSYLDSNKLKLIQSIGKLGGTEYQKIRYFSAILKNNLRDYEQKTETKEVIKTVDSTFYDVSDISCNAPTRRGLEEIEDEL